MKKLLAFQIIICFLIGHLAAQESTFSKGDKVLNLGLGLGSFLGSSYNTLFPPVSGTLEFGVADNILDKGSIGVGPYVGIGSYGYSYYSGKENYTFIVMGAKGAFHYPILNKLDTYLGLLMGYNIVSGTHVGNAISNRPIGELFLGGRYFFSEKWAAMLELGYGVVPVHIGIALKI
jgi:hypothetical protein